MLPQQQSQPQHHHLSAANITDPYLIDQLHFMQSQESTHYQQSNDDYFHSYSTVTPTDRRTMSSWSYDIVDACSISREIACIAISYFDRFLTTSSKRAQSSLVSRREFQLAFITCLIIALKCRAGMQVDSDFVSDTICQKLYCEEEICKMEQEILSALGWRLNGPSPHEFIGGFVELMPSTSSSSKMVEKLKKISHAQVEQAMLEYNMARRSPSSIAYVAILSAMQSLDAAAFHPLDRMAWMQNIAIVTGIKTNDARIMGHLALSSPSSPMTMSSPSRDNACRSARRMVSNEHVMCASPQGSYSTSVAGGVYSMSQQAYSYCSQVSPMDDSVASIRTENNEHLLFADVLSIASGGMRNNKSPVCAIIDGRIEIRDGN